MEKILGKSDNVSGGRVSRKRGSELQMQKKMRSKHISYFLFGLKAFFVAVRWLLKNNIFWWTLLALGSLGSIVFFKDTFVKKTQGYFSLNKIEFDGNEHVSEILLLKASKLHYKKSSLATRLDDVKNRLEKISWIKAVAVHRKLPGEILIRVAERVPVAILKKHNKLHLVDSGGVILGNDGIGNYYNLPIIAGEGAAKEIFSFLRSINKFPKIRKQLIFAIRVGRRRWNIMINQGITIKLPERGLLQAFGILDELADSKGLFNKDIGCLDLRIPDRVVITKKIPQISHN